MQVCRQQLAVQAPQTAGRLCEVYIANPFLSSHVSRRLSFFLSSTNQHSITVHIMLRNVKVQLSSCNLSRSFASGPRNRRRPLYHAARCLPISSSEETEGFVDQPPHKFQILYQDDDIVAIEKPAGGMGCGFVTGQPYSVCSRISEQARSGPAHRQASACKFDPTPRLVLIDRDI